MRTNLLYEFGDVNLEMKIKSPGYGVGEFQSPDPGNENHVAESGFAG